jgi:hypothetical protein
MIHQFRYGLLPWNAELYAAILEERRRTPHSALSMASGQTWSSRKRIQSHPALSDLLSLFRARLLEISGSDAWELSAWANISSDGGAIAEHDHSPNEWSGVYYLTRGAPIIFAAALLTIHPETGLLVIFPGSEPHSVAAQVGAAPRVSIAINATASGKVA